MTDEAGVSPKADELKVLDIEDNGLSEGTNPLYANTRNLIVGGQYVVGDTVQDANGNVIGKVNRVAKKDSNLSAEALAANSATINSHIGTTTSTDGDKVTDEDAVLTGPITGQSPASPKVAGK